MDLEIPGYDIIERIGSGGMASVYRASQKTFQRDVALKVLRQDLGSDEKYSERFVQESQIIARLHHSHIVQVYDVGQFKNLFYVAMEFLSGRNLSEMLRQQRVDRNRAVRIFSQIASALDYSHQKGIVHRDVKPDNIMFRDDGAAVLTDFGIAKDTDASMELTQTGTIMGTPKYMSPEQIRGGTVSPSSDLYSMGVVFFQMLTGSVPYSGATLVEVAVKHLNEPIPTLDDHLSHFQPIIDKILAKKPEDRYHRGKEILNDLAKVEHRAVNVLLDTDDEEDLLHDTGRLMAPIVDEADLDNQDSINNTVTNHDGVTLLSLEGMDQGIDATTIRAESPVTGKYKRVTTARAASHGDSSSTDHSEDDTLVAEAPTPAAAKKAELATSAPSRTGSTKRNTSEDPMDTTHWEYLLDQPEAGSEAEATNDAKPNWTLYSGIAIAFMIVVVVVAWIAPSVGPSEFPNTHDARLNTDATQPASPTVAGSVPPQNETTSGGSSVAPANAPTNALAESALDETRVVENSLVQGEVIKNEPSAKPADTPAVEQPVAEAVPAEAALDAETQATIAQLLAAARTDERGARLTQPLGNNALVKYRQVLALDAENTDAQLGISRIADHFVANAEQFPSKENMGLAYSVLSDAKDASPGNPYLYRINQRLKVVTDSTKASANQADTLYKKLQVQGLLRSAEIDEREGRLMAPAHNNAADKYRKVLDIDPSNKVASERLASIEQDQP